MRLHPYFLTALTCLFLSACGPESDETSTNIAEDENSPPENQNADADADADADGDEDEYTGPTFYGDIQPLMQTHCTSCHIQDAVAPFALQTYDEVKAAALVSYAAMNAGTMPPWPPAEDCQEFQGHRGISAEEIDLFKAWMDNDYPQGNPNNAAPSEETAAFELDAPDLSVSWGFDYRPTPVGGDEIDDYRCFIVDVPTDEDVFVNLVDTQPGNLAVVHHMIAYMAPPSQFERLEQLEAEDERPGYTCFGGPRFSDPEMLAGWVPGATPIPYQEGFGIRLPAENKLVVQMHYNTVNDPEGTDQTELNLHFVDREQYPQPRELVIVPLADYDLFVAAGDPDGVAGTSGPSIPIPVMLHGIAPHMHMLGSAIKATITSGEEEMCLIDIPLWDFNWQGFYVYERPIRIPPPSVAHLECRFDNSPSNQAPGRDPQDITWGDGTYDEMCIVYFIIERPPGF